MQQAELLSSLALKVNTDNTEQSLENAWKVLQDILNQSQENDIFRYTISDIDFQLEDFKDLLEDLSSNEGSRPTLTDDLYVLGNLICMRHLQPAPNIVQSQQWCLIRLGKKEKKLKLR
ncbi:hypothetical protein REPUB_Repub07fG0109900 [Reevesia pubescens]